MQHVSLMILQKFRCASTQSATVRAFQFLVLLILCYLIFCHCFSLLIPWKRITLYILYYHFLLSSQSNSLWTTSAIPHPPKVDTRSQLEMLLGSSKKATQSAIPCGSKILGRTLSRFLSDQRLLRENSNTRGVHNSHETTQQADQIEHNNDRAHVGIVNGAHKSESTAKLSEAPQRLRAGTSTSTPKGRVIVLPLSPISSDKYSSTQLRLLRGVSDRQANQNPVSLNPACEGKSKRFQYDVYFAKRYATLTKLLRLGASHI